MLGETTVTIFSRYLQKNGSGLVLPLQILKVQVCVNDHRYMYVVVLLTTVILIFRELFLLRVELFLKSQVKCI